MADDLAVARDEDLLGPGPDGGGVLGLRRTRGHDPRPIIRYKKEREREG